MRLVTKYDVTGPFADTENDRVALEHLLKDKCKVSEGDVRYIMSIAIWYDS
jgi:hypothetical protein